MRKIIFINLILVAIYFIAFLLSLVDFPYLLYIIGLLVFFLPGLNFALVLEQITHSRQEVAKIFLWSFLFSLTLTPLFIFIFSSWRGSLADEKITLIAFGIWWAISLILFLGSYFWQKFKPTDLKIPSWRKNKIFWLAMAVFVGTIGIHLILYRYIPEADGYKYLIDIQRLIQEKQFIAAESRPLFLAFSWLLLFLTKIPLYWIFKILFPLLAIFSLVAFYQNAKTILPSKIWQFFAALGFLVFPVIVLEILIPRSQSLFLISLAPTLYLLNDLTINRKNKDIYWFLLLLLVAILGIKIHNLFILSSIFILAGLIYSLWSQIKKYPLQSFLIVAFVAIGAYPWFRDLGFLEQITYLAQFFWRIILHPKFDLWFIDNYINIDGNRVGWPGFGQVYYYGYNLGIVFPILILITIIKKVKFNLDLKNNWIYFLSFLIFFSIAEIFPRLGLAFLPDRAWLFVSVSLVFFMPVLLKNIFPFFSEKILLKGTIFLIFISFLLSWGLTWIKQGLVTPKECQAAHFIRENLPSDCAIISQDGNTPLISYFSQRLSVTPAEKFFLDNDLNYNLDFLKSLPEYISKKEYYLSQKESLEVVLRENVDQIILVPPSSTNNEEGEFLKNYKNYQSIKKRIYVIEKEKLDIKRPIYILYSYDKFSGLYGKREWWEKANFYGADLDKYDNNSQYFEKIYDRDGVKIWHYKGE